MHVIQPHGGESGDSVVTTSAFTALLVGWFSAFSPFVRWLVRAFVAGHRSQRRRSCDGVGRWAIEHAAVSESSMCFLDSYFMSIKSQCTGNRYISSGPLSEFEKNSSFTIGLRVHRSRVGYAVSPFATRRNRVGEFGGYMSWSWSGMTGTGMRLATQR